MSKDINKQRWGWIFPLSILLVTTALVAYAVVQWIIPGGAATGEHEGHAAEAPSAETTNNDSLIVSPQAEQNIGMTTATVQLQDFAPTVTIPGRIIERPGRSRMAVSAPLTGVIEQILALPGEAIAPGQPLFRMRLTHQEVIRLQTELLNLTQQLAVTQQEIERLEEAAASGALPGKTLLLSQYEKQKLEASINANKQGLLLLGLTQEQVDSITTDGRLIREMTICVPAVEDDLHCCIEDHLLLVSQIETSVGEQVESGQRLALVADYCSLYIEGNALEQDTALLSDAVARGLLVTAMQEREQGKLEIPNLRIQFLDSEVDMETRALRFYVELPNRVIREPSADEGPRFISWEFRPGQRLEVLVPSDSWENCIVLPAKAVVQDGIESFVFIKQDEKCDRKLVVEQYRDANHVVVANDGSLFPGDQVVVQGAYQLFLMMKNRGGTVDPHAGHNH